MMCSFFLSLEVVAQCKKSTSTCNTTAIRNAFTAANYIELGCGMDSCSIYFLDPNLSNSVTANTLAQSLGGYITSINNSNVNDSIVSWVTNLGYTGSVRIGLNDDDNNGVFEWYDKSSATYNNWLAGYPINNINSSNCAELILDPINVGKWRDFSCNQLRRTVVKISLCFNVNTSDYAICLNDSTNLVPIVSDGGIQPLTFSWSTGSTDSVINVKPTADSSYYITVTDKYDCSTVDTSFVTVNPLPSENIGNDTTVCEGVQLSFRGLTTGTVYNRWIINFNEPTIDTVESYQLLNNDTANSIVYYGLDINQCPAYDTIFISRDTLPIIQLGNDTTICKGDSLTLDAGPKMFSYTWNILKNTQTIKVSAASNYSVFVTDSNGCMGSGNITLDTHRLPDFEILRNGKPGDTSICINDSVLLTVDTLSSYLYSWNGSPFSLGDDSMWVKTAGTNKVTIRDQNTCEFNDSLIVSLDTLPITYIRSDTSICIGDSILLKVNSSPNYLHIWDNINLGTLDTMWVKNNQTYSIELIDIATTCKQEDTVRIGHDTIPIISLGNDTIICFGDTLNIDAGPNMMSYLWSNSETTQTIKANSANVYTVDVVNLNGCKTSGSRTLFIKQIPTPNLGPDISYCQGTPINESLDAGKGYVLYNWSTGKNGDSTLARRDTVTNAGRFWVKVTDTVGCIGLDTIDISSDLAPAIDLGVDTFFCDGDKFDFLISAGPGLVKYEWFDITLLPAIQTLPSVGQVLLISDTAITVYCQVTDAKGCINRDTISTIKIPTPSIDLGPTDFYCESNRTQFLDSLKADPNQLYQKYIWSTGDTSSTYVATESGTYTVTVTAKNGCKSVDKKEIIEVAKPTVNFRSDSVYCEGDPFVLDASTDGYLNYFWYKNFNILGKSDSIMNPLLEPIDSGWHDTTYSKITLQQEGDFKVVIKYGQSPGCVDTAFAEIRKDIKPEIGFSVSRSDTTLCIGEILDLQPNFSKSTTHPNNLTFEWQDGSTDSLYKVKSSGIYQLIMTNDCGAGIRDVDVSFEDCSHVFIPNAFTPNDDGDNDLWGIKSLENFFDFRLTVFNRFGDLVWESTLPGIKWDGTHMKTGNPLEIGNYVFKLTYRSKHELIEGVNSAPTKEIRGKIYLSR